MTGELIYYHPAVLLRGEARPGQDLNLFSHLFRVLKDVPLVDRSDTIRFPVSLSSVSPLPAYRRTTATFEELCDRRAREIVDRAERLDCPIAVMWSGGIDSTLVLVSLLKLMTRAQADRVTVLLSEESIAEAPAFYRDHIAGRLRLDTASRFVHLLGTRTLFVTGEHNDQLFGSDMIGQLMARFGPERAHQPYDRALMQAFFGRDDQHAAQTSFYVDLFERLARAAPVPIDTNFLHLWWINFTLKWQAVFLRTLSYASDASMQGVNRDYVSLYYCPFFCTDDFQIWSMNNPDKKMRSSWKTYKWVCKDIIYDYTKDLDYRDNKMKKGSLFSLILQNYPFLFATGEYRFFRDLPPGNYHRDDNDFQWGPPTAEPFVRPATARAFGPLGASRRRGNLTSASSVVHG